MCNYLLRSCYAGLASLGVFYSLFADAAGYAVNEQSASAMGAAYAGRASQC